MANFFEKLLCPSVKKGEEALESVSEFKDHFFDVFAPDIKKTFLKQQEQITELSRLLKNVNDSVEALTKADVYQAGQMEFLLLAQHSLDTRLQALEKAPEETNPEVTGVTLDKTCVDFFTQLVEREYKDDKLIQAQRRFSNRLLRLLWKAIGSKTDLAVSEELLKAEKWNKVLRKRFAHHNKEVRHDK